MSVLLAGDAPEPSLAKKTDTLSSADLSYLEELEAEADEADVFRRRRRALGETDTSSFFFGDLTGAVGPSTRRLFTWGPVDA